MSEHKVSGGTMLLLIDPNGGDAYDTVICLRSVSITDSVASIDISSWCGPGKIPGLNDISLSFDGFHVQDPSTGNISGTDLRILLRNKTTISWKLSPLSPQAGDEIQTGLGFISDLSSTYAFDNVGTFNFTINVKGNVTTTITAGFYLGQEYGGGIIAYIDESGEHGLIRAPGEYIEFQIWSNGNIFTGYTSVNYSDGYNNTIGIYSNDSTAYACYWCLINNIGGYADWFLPTLNEISAIQSVGQLPTSFISDTFWTSSEINMTNATTFDIFGNDNSIYKYNTYLIMPCRYF